MKIWRDHAIERVEKYGRLSGLVNQDDVRSINNEVKRLHREGRSGKYYLIVRMFSSEIHIDANDCGGSNTGVNGDCLCAVVEGCQVKTVMVTKSWRKDYFSDGKIITL